MQKTYPTMNGTEPAIVQPCANGWPISWNPDDRRWYVEVPGASGGAPPPQKKMQKMLGFSIKQRVHTGVATINRKETEMNTTSQIPTTQIETNYLQFVAELTALTRKYGVAIQSIGGVILADDPDEFRNVRYVADITSGDLYPQFTGV